MAEIGMKDSNGYIYRTGLGQDSHRFLTEESSKPCLLGGIVFEEAPGFSADSDGDIILHAICHAISTLTGVNVMMTIARDLCSKDGITDSQVYVEKALELMKDQQIVHVAVALEGRRPRISDKIVQITEQLAKILKIEKNQIGITCTTGEGLTDFGCGDGMQCFCIITTKQRV